MNYLNNDLFVFVNKGSDEALLKSLEGNNLTGQYDLQKAIDRTKLVQREITDKNGHRKKVWVKPGDDQKVDKPVGKPPTQSANNSKDNDKSYSGDEAVDRVGNLKLGSVIEITTKLKDGSTVTGEYTLQNKKYALGTTKAWVKTGGNHYQGDFAPNKLTVKRVIMSSGISVKIKKAIGDNPKVDNPTKPTQSAKTSIDFTTPSDGNTKQAISALLSKHSKQDIMAAAKQSGITWKGNDHEGINWMRASMAIQKHMKSGASADNAGNVDKKADEKQDFSTKYPEASKYVKDLLSKISQSGDKDWQQKQIPGIGMTSVIKDKNGKLQFELPSYGANYGERLSEDDEELYQKIQQGFNTKNTKQSLGKDEVAKRKEFIKSTNKRIRKEAGDYINKLDATLKSNKEVVVNDGKNTYKISRLTDGNWIHIPSDNSGNVDIMSRDLAKVFGNIDYGDTNQKIIDKQNLAEKFRVTVSPTDSEYDENSLNNTHPSYQKETEISQKTNKALMTEMNSFARSMHWTKSGDKTGSSVSQSFSNGDKVIVSLIDEGDGWKNSNKQISYYSASLGKTFEFDNVVGYDVSDLLSCCMVSSLTKNDSAMKQEHLESIMDGNYKDYTTLKVN